MMRPYSRGLQCIFGATIRFDLIIFAHMFCACKTNACLHTRISSTSGLCAGLSLLIIIEFHAGSPHSCNNITISRYDKKLYLIVISIRRQQRENNIKSSSCPAFFEGILTLWRLKVIY
jgi:hypothetical protein